MNIRKLLNKHLKSPSYVFYVHFKTLGKVLCKPRFDLSHFENPHFENPHIIMGKSIRAEIGPYFKVFS